MDRYPHSNRSSALQASDVVFDTILVLSTMAASWLWVRDPIARITAEVMLVISNTIAIYLYHRPPKNLVIDDFKAWTLFFGISAAITLIFVRLELVWWDFAVLFVRGNQEKALSLLDEHPQGGYPMFVGLFCSYACLANLLRLVYKRVLRFLT